MSSSLTSRLTRLQQSLKDHKLQALLVSSPHNLTYLTNISFSPFHREAFLVVTPLQARLLVSPLRLSEFTRLRHLHPQSFGKDHPLSETINQITQSSRTIGIEADDLRVEELNNLNSKLKGNIKPTTDIIATLRLIKDQQEINCITKACQLTTQAWKWLLPQIKPGITEQDLSRLLINHLYELGADGVPKGFDPIVASGPNSAIPHHTTSSRIVRAGEPVLVDFGCSIKGYASDFTRTVFIGEPTRQFLHIESVICSAYHQALKSLSAETSVKADLAEFSSPQQIDQQVRQVISDAGFGDNFIHNTGHGLGLEIHEPPHFHYQYQEPNPLQPGMTIAIEPGIYLPGKFGYRYENTLLVTKSKPKTLT